MYSVTLTTLRQPERQRTQEGQLYTVVGNPSRGARWRWHLRYSTFYYVHKLDRGLTRTFDILLAGVALVVLSPVFLAIAIGIKWSSPGPVFYCSTRVGQFGERFMFYKFRTMIINAEALKDTLLSQNQSCEGLIFKMKEDPRVTRIGRFLRRYSLDELPQLYNVLKGDMAIVGPRPPIEREVMSYSFETRKRLNIKPGLTCYWQVSGRSLLPFSEQVKLDKKYIAHHNTWINLKILGATVLAVLSGKGAY